MMSPSTTGWKGQRTLGLYSSKTAMEALTITCSDLERRHAVVEFRGLSAQPAKETNFENCTSFIDAL